MKKTLSHISTIVEWSVFILIIFIFIVVMSPLLPIKRLFATYVVPTGSMEPTIHAGSVVIVKPINPDDLNTGDIIAFTDPADPKLTILHRIIEKNYAVSDYEFQTKGDNNNAPDNFTITKAAVKGKLVISVPYLGHPVSALRTPLGYILLVGIPALLLVILQIKNIIQGIKEEVDKRKKKKSQTETFIASIIGLLIFSSFALATVSIHIPKAFALFSDNAKISGISISVASSSPTALPAPLLRTPTNGSTLHSDDFKETWTKIDGATQYIYQRCKIDPSTNGGVCPAQKLTQATYTDSDKQYIDGEWRIVRQNWGIADKTYWWKVKAKNSTSESPWSETWNYTVKKDTCEHTCDHGCLPPLPDISFSKPNWWSIIFKLQNLFEGFDRFKYELTYDSTSGKQGVMGTQILSNTPEFTSSEIELGTCSTTECRYDEDVHNIKLHIELFTDGSDVAQTIDTDY